MNIDLDLTSITASAIAVVPLIVALVQAVKQTGWLSNRFAPLLSIGFGILISFIADHNTADATNTLLSGVVYGLSASGLYSGIKSTAHGVNNNKNSI